MSVPLPGFPRPGDRYDYLNEAQFRSAVESAIASLDAAISEGIEVIASDLTFDGAMTFGDTVTFNGAVNAGAVAIDFSSAVSFLFPAASVTEAMVTQHEAALSVAWGQLTGVPATFPPSAHTHPFTAITGQIANAQVPASAVTQHESALTILESQITDGSVLARLAAAETVTGDWSFTGDVSFVQLSLGIGGLGIPDGTALEPSLFFSSVVAEDVGLYQAAAGDIGFAVGGGVVPFRIRSSNLLASTSLEMSNNRITGLLAPSASDDAATKGYVDSVVTGGHSLDDHDDVAYVGGPTPGDGDFLRWNGTSQQWEESADTFASISHGHSVSDITFDGNIGLGTHRITFGTTPWEIYESGGNLLLSENGSGNFELRIRSGGVTGASASIVDITGALYVEGALEARGGLDVTGASTFDGNLSTLSHSAVFAGVLTNYGNTAPAGPDAAWPGNIAGLQMGIEAFRHSNDGDGTADGEPMTPVNNANGIVNIYSHATSGTRPYGKQLWFTANNDLYMRLVNDGGFGSWAKFITSLNLDAEVAALGYLTADDDIDFTQRAVFTGGANTEGSFVLDSTVNYTAGAGNEGVPINATSLGGVSLAARARIVPWQANADADTVGWRIYTHPSSLAADPMELAMEIGGGLVGGPLTEIFGSGLKVSSGTLDVEGHATFTGGLTRRETASAVSSYIEITAASDANAGVQLQVTDTLRWLLYRQTDNDFAIARYNTSGVFQDTPFVIDFSTGNFETLNTWTHEGIFTSTGGYIRSLNAGNAAILIRSSSNNRAEILLDSADGDFTGSDYWGIYSPDGASQEFRITPAFATSTDFRVGWTGYVRVSGEGRFGDFASGVNQGLSIQGDSSGREKMIWMRSTSGQSVHQFNTNGSWLEYAMGGSLATGKIRFFGGGTTSSPIFEIRPFAEVTGAGQEDGSEHQSRFRMYASGWDTNGSNERTEHIQQRVYTVDSVYPDIRMAWEDGGGNPMMVLRGRGSGGNYMDPETLEVYGYATISDQPSAIISGADEARLNIRQQYNGVANERWMRFRIDGGVYYMEALTDAGSVNQIWRYVMGANVPDYMDHYVSDVRWRADPTSDSIQQRFYSDNVVNFDFRDASTSLPTAYIVVQNNGDIQIRNSGYSPWVHFDETDERVGIGITTPGYKLHVNGTFLASGLLTADGGIDLPSAEVMTVNGATGAITNSRSHDYRPIVVRQSGGTRPTMDDGTILMEYD